MRREDGILPAKPLGIAQLRDRVRVDDLWRSRGQRQRQHLRQIADPGPTSRQPIRASLISAVSVWTIEAGIPRCFATCSPGHSPHPLARLPWPPARSLPAFSRRAHGPALANICGLRDRERQFGCAISRQSLAASIPMSARTTRPHLLLASIRRCDGFKAPKATVRSKAGTALSSAPESLSKPLGMSAAIRMNAASASLKSIEETEASRPLLRPVPNKASTRRGADAVSSSKASTLPDHLEHAHLAASLLGSAKAATRTGTPRSARYRAAT